MQLFFPIVSGVLVFVLGQIFLKLFLETYLDHKKAIGKIYYSLGYYANVYTTPHRDQTTYDETTNQLRGLCFELLGTYHAIPFHRFFSKLHLLRKETDIEQAAKHLMALSNETGSTGTARGISTTQAVDAADKIKKYLGLPHLD